MSIITDLVHGVHIVETIENAYFSGNVPKTPTEQEMDFIQRTLRNMALSAQKSTKTIIFNATCLCFISFMPTDWKWKGALGALGAFLIGSYLITRDTRRIALNLFEVYASGRAVPFHQNRQQFHKHMEEVAARGTILFQYF